jgi:Flp pilus assembly protein TadD
MLSHGYDWLIAYLNGLRRDEALVAAQDTPSLPLQREPDGQQRGGPLTTLADVATVAQLAFVGPAGAGKTTLLRQLAADATQACLDGVRRGLATNDLPPVPILFDLAHFQGSLEASLAIHLGPHAPRLATMAQHFTILLLLDGLDRMPAATQLAGLADIRSTLAALGGRVRWATTCRSDTLALVRPWLATAQIYQIEPLAVEHVQAALEHAHGSSAADWLREQPELMQLVRRPRWLAALLQNLPPSPIARGPLLAALLMCVLSETSALPVTDLLQVLPELAAAMEQFGRGLTIVEAQATLADCADPAAVLRLMLDAGILVQDAQQHTSHFTQPLLFDTARALGLAHMPPTSWPDVALTRPWRETVLFAFGLHHERITVLRWLLDHEAAELCARCLAETVAPEQFELFLAQSGGLTPALRVRLADAMSVLGLSAAAIAQLERSGAEGYEEIGLFRRLGDLYAHTAQWRHARVAYTQVLAREPDDLRYRKRLGIACSRLGEFAEAETALQSVIAALRHIQAEAAAELGLVYATQGRLEIALSAYQQAVAAQPGTPAYHRGMATTLHRLGRSAAAEDILRDLLSVHADDAEAHADLGQIYADTGRYEQAIAALARSTALRPDQARY